MVQQEGGPKAPSPVLYTYDGFTLFSDRTGERAQGPICDMIHDRALGPLSGIHTQIRGPRPYLWYSRKEGTRPPSLLYKYEGFRPLSSRPWALFSYLGIPDRGPLSGIPTQIRGPMPYLCYTNMRALCPFLIGQARGLKAPFVVWHMRGLKALYLVKPSKGHNQMKKGPRPPSLLYK